MSDTDTPRVDALIDEVMAKHTGFGKTAQAAYYEAVHQKLAPLARQLEHELAVMREERDSQQRVCIKVMKERDALRAEVESLRDKAIRFDLDQAGIEQRERIDVELVERRAEVERLRAEVERLRADAERSQDIAPLLASTWFYGGWRAETKNERDMQEIMERAGWWPIRSDAELMDKIEAARAGEKGGE